MVVIWYPSGMGERVILHIDMNAFFASVEQQSNPALRGKPIAVIGSAKRTVVTTCSYEARAYGVKTGMTVWEAKRNCPHLILVVGNNRKYTWTSARIIKIFLDYTPLVEVFSIDEAFLDITASQRLFGPPERIACLIKARIRHLFGITCSIGIAPNKLLAKLASEMRKPDGLVVIGEDEVQRVLENLPVRELCGVGSKTRQKLELLGIRSCGELGRFPVEVLRKKFGIIGERLHLMGLGIDDSPVIPAEEADEVKSVGHSMTLEHDISLHKEILRYLLQLSEMVGRRARRYNVRGRTVTLSIRYADFDTWLGRQETLAEHINRSEDIYRAAAAILDTLVLEQPVRLLGVRLSSLSYQGSQLPLFEEERKKTLMIGAVDQVNDRYGDFTVTFGSILDEDEKGSRVISPAWRPEGIRNIEVG
jgi:DNA polymerase-4